MADDTAVPDVPDGTRPEFLRRDLTDDALQADLDRLKAGHYPQWRLVGEARYVATQMDGDKLTLCRFLKLWLESGADRRLEVVLVCPPHSTTWQRQPLPEA